MKEYPYIGKGKNNGHIYLVVSDSSGYIIAGVSKIEYGVFVDKLHTWSMKDVTREYLEDKVIKVLSPEHSEFLQKIAFRYDFRWCSAGKEVQYTEKPYLYFYPDNDITFGRENDIGWKEIFIPLPESGTEFKVDDKVSLRYKYGSKSIHCTGKLLYLSDKHIILEDASGNDIYKLRCDYAIEEALTAEEIFKEKLLDCIEPMLCWERCEAENFITDLENDGYTITKKPQ